MELVMIGGLIGIFVVIGVFMYSFYRKEKKLSPYNTVLEHLDSYQTRITTMNRFLCDLATLKKLFPEYDHETLANVFRQLVKNHVIVRDPIDAEWILSRDVKHIEDNHDNNVG